MTAPKTDDLLCVQIAEAAPHKMPHFEEMRPWIRFLIYNKKVECAACKKKRKKMWTMLVEFRAVDFENSIVIGRNFPGSFAPLTPVCDDHPIGPNLPDSEPT